MSKVSSEKIDEYRKGFNDASGKQRVFAFFEKTLLDGIELCAEEIGGSAEGCYYFQVYSNSKSKGALFEELIGKIEKGLATQSLEPLNAASRYAGGMPGYHIREGCNHYSARILNSGVVIDGVFMSYSEFGRMMSSYEGFVMRVEIVDLNDA